MSAAELVSLIASLASLILAVIAIWLSLYFYKSSSEMANQAKDSANAIESGVTRLEKLFDSLYTDTFSIMRETVTDMRRHIWPTEEEEASVLEQSQRIADEKIEELKESTEKEISALASSMGVTGDRLNELLEKVEVAIAQSRQADTEAQEETIQSLLLEAFNRLSKGPIPFVTAGDLLEELASVAPPTVVLRELFKLQGIGLLEWEGNLGPNTRIFRAGGLKRFASFRDLARRRARDRAREQRQSKQEGEEES